MINIDEFGRGKYVIAFGFAICGTLLFAFGAKLPGGAEPGGSLFTIFKSTSLYMALACPFIYWWFAKRFKEWRKTLPNRQLYIAYFFFGWFLAASLVSFSRLLFVFHSLH